MLSTYKEVLLLMAPVYLAYKKSLTTDKESEYSTLLIDKFASHSSSFYHITDGFIESIHSTTDRRLMGFDIFTFNSTFRAIIETYVAFHGLFINPKDEEEKRAKFLLWKIEGLSSKAKLELEENINSAEAAKKSVELLENEFEESGFYKLFAVKEINKIFKRREKHNWKFTVSEDEIKAYGRLNFAKLLTQSTVIGNLYNLSSMYVHSSFYAIEQFRKIRGKIINNEYVNSYIAQAIYLTACLIMDLRGICQESNRVYESMEDDVKEIIQMTYGQLRGK